MDGPDSSPDSPAHSPPPGALPVTLRPPRHDELAALRVIERAAARRFRGSRYPEVAQMAPTELEVLQGLGDGEGLIAAFDARERPLGFALYMPLDGQMYLGELNVVPEAAGRRLGARLVAAVEAVAAERGCAWLLLTTFRDIPWNAPYYGRLGFAEVPAAEMGPELRRQLDEQARRGLQPSSRVAMRRAVREVGTPAPARDPVRSG
jgi:GNAT superfamily N-acetyltransferase